MFKKIVPAVLALLIFISGCGKTSNETADNKLRVSASFYTMYDFAKKIGGDKADVSLMIPAGIEPHDWEPSTSDILSLEKADMFVYNGAGMEPWAQDILSSLQNKQLKTAEASQGIASIDSDPHVWLDPKCAKSELMNIKNAFTEVDPDSASYYEENYNTYAEKLDALDKEYRDTLSALPGRNIVVTHQAFGYLCAAYGLNQVAIEGISAEAEPSPARMAEIVNFVKENGIKVIFFEELISPKVAETIARETGAQTAVLNPIEGLTSEAIAAGEDYFSVMRKNLAELKKALE
jgi:zinc transport system substrate-binding protein